VGLAFHKKMTIQEAIRGLLELIISARPALHEVSQTGRRKLDEVAPVYVFRCDQTTITRILPYLKSGT
jgi:hypothetical protein